MGMGMPVAVRMVMVMVMIVVMVVPVGRMARKGVRSPHAGARFRQLPPDFGHFGNRLFGNGVFNHLLALTGRQAQSEQDREENPDG